MTPPNRALWLIPAFVMLATPGRAADTEALAQQLSALRAEVEALSEELELERAATREELESLAGRKAELEAELQREELRLKRVSAALLEQRNLVAQAKAAEADLVPILEQSAAELRRYIEASLPFKREARLRSVDDIAEGVAGSTLRPSKAAMRLWSLVQDELRLCKESGLYRQAVTLEDREHLADVARIGMVLLYFQTADGRVGRAINAQGSWRYEVLKDEGDQQAVRKLFDSFQKQVRTGLFEVPAVLPQKVAQ